MNIWLSHLPPNAMAYLLFTGIYQRKEDILLVLVMLIVESLGKNQDKCEALVNQEGRYMAGDIVRKL